MANFAGQMVQLIRKARQAGHLDGVSDADVEGMSIAELEAALLASQAETGKPAELADRISKW